LGGFAFGVHGQYRATKDLDLWIEPTHENATKVIAALRAFGAPLENLSEADLVQPDLIWQMGVEPCRVELLTRIEAVNFAEAWESRVRARFGPIEAGYLGKDLFIRNKRAVGRPRDLLDIREIED